VLEFESFSQVTLDFSHAEWLQCLRFGTDLPILFSSYVGTHKNGEPRVSLDIDANRLILLDRVSANEPEIETF